MYLHMGRSYLVLDLDLAGRRALLEPFTGNYFTQAKRESMIYITRLHDQRETCGVTLSFGEIAYAETVLGYQRKRLQDHEVIDFQTLDLPTVEFATRALWYELDEADRRRAVPARAPAGRAPRARAWADRGAAADRDVRPVGHRRPVDQRPSARPADRRSSSTTAIPAASGSPDAATTSSSAWSVTRHRLIGECPCRSGCRSCVQSPKCGNLNEPLSKRGALELLRRLGSLAECLWGGGNRQPRNARAPVHSSPVEGHRARARRWGTCA